MAENVTLHPDRPRFALWRSLKSFGLLRESPIGLIGAGITAFWVLVALIAPFAAPFSPTELILPFAEPLSEAPDGGRFWFGTDNLGRDILSRIMWGARTVLILAPIATFGAFVVGILMGVAAGYWRGWLDEALSFLSNVILSFPVLVLYIIIIATIGASAVNIVVAVTFASAPGIMRIVRGLVLDLRNRSYVAAAQTRGESSLFIMLVEILPNARGPIIVDAMLRLGYVTITIAVLGFLGLGLPPPSPDWGSMINQARPMMIAFPYMAIFPAAAISSLVLGFNLLADGLREISLKD